MPFSYSISHCAAPQLKEPYQTEREVAEATSSTMLGFCALSLENMEMRPGPLACTSIVMALDMSTVPALTLAKCLSICTVQIVTIDLRGTVHAIGVAIKSNLQQTLHMLANPIN